MDVKIFFVILSILSLMNCDIFITSTASKAIIGEDFIFTCITNATALQFKELQKESICTITGVQENGSCVIDGQCRKKYVYTCDKTNNVYNVTVPLAHVDEIHNEEWKCDSVFGGKESKSIKIYVNVPVVNVTFKTHIVLDGDTFNVTEKVMQNIECSTNAIRPSATIEWYLGNKTITKNATSPTQNEEDKVISSSKLSYKFNRSEQGEVLRCIASNIAGYMPVESQRRKINVQYGPSYITIAPDKLSFTTTENASIGPIKCSSSCNPKCSNKWAGPGITEMLDNLTINNIRRNQTGNYYCSSSNVIGNDKMEIFIDVQYNAPVDLKIITGNSTIEENTDVSLSCRADGNPIPDISWLFTRQQQTIKLKTDNETTDSTFKITSSKCDDTGKYICTANNAILPSHMSAIDLNVTCKPRINTSCSINNSTIVQRNIDTILSICWISNPIPKVTWKKVDNGNHIENISIYPVTQTLYNSVLKTHFETEGNVTYRIIAKNGYGTSDSVILTVVVNGTFVLGVNQEVQSSRLKIISVAAGSVFAILVILVVTIVIVKCRKHKTAYKGEDRDMTSSAAINTGYSLDSNLPLYAKVKNPNKKKQCTESVSNDEKSAPIYAEVVKKKPGTTKIEHDSSNVYSVVNKSNKSKEKPSSNKTSSKQESGLVYVELAFDRKNSGKKFVFKDTAPHTEYGEIDFTKKADPLPSDDDEDTTENFTY